MAKTIYTKCAGGVIINNNNEVVVVNQNHDSWSLPKGHIDKNESALSAAKREIYEEAGITDLLLIKPLGSYKRYKIGLDGNDDKSEYKEIFIYLFKSNQIELTPHDPRNPQAKWIECDKVYDLLTHPEDKKFYNHTLALWLNI